MHPETMRAIVSQQAAELHAAAQAARRVRRAKHERAAASLPTGRSGLAAIVRGRYSRRLRRLGHELPAQTQSA
jgi:hypothetical protein